MKVNILGYGLMGKQIAALLYLGGFDICIWNYKVVNEKDMLRQIKLLKRSFSTEKEGSLTFYTDLNDLPDAITIESVVENLEIKRELYKHFENSKSLYFTNSSSFSPSEISEKVNGFHFFNPINLKLLEMYLSNTTSISKFESILNYLQQIEFEIVEVNSNRGYIGNYILFNEIASALKLIEKFNYSYEQVDLVYNKLYDGRNLFMIIDLIGIDVVYQILKNLKDDDESIYLPKCLSIALDKNILGRKNKTSLKEVLR